jgi:hypothetical protein
LREALRIDGAFPVKQQSLPTELPREKIIVILTVMAAIHDGYTSTCRWLPKLH